MMNPMTIHSSAINEQGIIHDRFGKRGTDFSPSGMPNRSIPFQIENAPKNTQSFAIVLDDKDAITASGFVWVHWLIADLTVASLPENDSANPSHSYTQGANSWASVLTNFSIEEASQYGGMAPPNCLHRYDLTVYALDCKLNLPSGFRFNDLHYAIQGHVLATATITGTYDV